MLLRVSLQMDLESNDMAERTGSVRTRTEFHQSYIAEDFFIQAGDVDEFRVPAVISAVNNL